MDPDQDGLDERCEFVLARAFAPLLMVPAGGCNWDQSVTPARPGGEYYFAVQRARTAGRIRIAYLPAYYRDCGWKGIKCWVPFVDCSPHVGDSEAVVVQVGFQPQTGRWSAEAIFLSAHCFDGSGGDCRWYRGEALGQFEWAEEQTTGAPVVWVAEGRNANYPSRQACDRGHYFLDTCERNHLEFRFPVITKRQNVGSRVHPVGRKGGCVTADQIGWGSRVPRPHERECFWSPAERFFGWQERADERGTTPYLRYLEVVAGF